MGISTGDHWKLRLLPIFVVANVAFSDRRNGDATGFSQLDKAMMR